MKQIILLLVLLTLVPRLTSAASVQGMATVDGQPVAGVEVKAYPASSFRLDDGAAYHSATTKVDGLFKLELPVGAHYLVATGAGRFSFYGRNPVTVPEAGLEKINLLMLPSGLPVPEVESVIETGVAGTISVHGEPVPGAMVTVYPDLSSQLKGMGLGWAPPSDDTGYFEMPLSAGTYYLVVRVRKSGKMAGPLQSGDLFGYLAGNPLVVKEGELARVHIPLLEVPEKIERHAASMFGNTLVTGRVLDTQGQPVAGLQVLLYEDPMMLNRPLYVSSKTDGKGRYQLSFPSGGHFYLAARNELGGTPAPGELYGRYQGSADHAIEIETGKTLEDIEIIVEEVY